MDARLRAVVAIAGRYGVRVAEPVVLRDRSNLLVRLDPAPVVARVAAQTTAVRHGPAWLAREVALAAFLAERGAPVVPPSPLLPAGPHEEGGIVVTFWTDWEDAFAGPVGWDVACLLASDRAGSSTAAAATEHVLPTDALDALIEARRLQAAAWAVVLGRARADAAMAERGLALLRT